jgi:SAM-dependent methyltransferase
MTFVTARKLWQQYKGDVSATRVIADPAAADQASVARVPGPSLLARAGKRVLRPGGVAVTARLLNELTIGACDTVVELAPGLGATAEQVLSRAPFSYLGVDRDYAVVDQLNQRLARDGVRFVEGDAEDTGLPGETATVLFGEAMLTMQPETSRRGIVQEAWRVLRSRGRYGLHELCLWPDGLAHSCKRVIEIELTQALQQDIRLLTPHDWRDLVEAAGFSVRSTFTAPMRMLEPGSLIRDEGIRGATRLAVNLACSPATLRRVHAIRAVLHRWRHHLRAIACVCDKRY